MKRARNSSSNPYAALFEIGWGIGGSLNLEDILQEGLNLSLSALQAEAGAVYLLESDEQRLARRAAHGIAPGANEEQVFLRQVEVLMKDAEFFRKPQALSARGTDAQNSLTQGFHRAVLIPLTAGAEVAGALWAGYRSEERLLEMDMDFLLALGQRLGESIYHAQVYERLQTELRTREMVEEFLARQADAMNALYETFLEINSQRDLRTLLQAIVRRAAILLGARIGGVYMVEPDRQWLRLEVGYQLPPGFIGTRLRVGEGLSGKVVQTGEIGMVEDYQTWEGRAPQYQNNPFRRSLAVPMKSGGEVIGVIAVTDEQTKGYTEEDVRLLRLFADQAALAVEKVRLYEAERLRSAELARANQLLSALNQATSLAATTVNPAEIVEILGEELQRHGFGTLVALLDSSNRELAVRYVSFAPVLLEKVESTLGVRLNELRFPRSVPGVNELLTQRRPVFESDPASLVESALPPRHKRMGRHALNLLGFNDSHAAIVLPLTGHEQPLGLMMVWGEDLHVEDIFIFVMFANQVAAALENARLVASIQRQAIMDELTGLYNRRGFFALAEQQMRVLTRMKKTAMLIFVDVDGLKGINDTLGHQVGDQALVDTAAILKRTFRESDIVARMGGDEFAILALESTEANPQTVERLEYNLAAFNAASRRPYSLALSIGTVSWTPERPMSLDELLGRADSRMYQQKQGRKSIRP